MSPLSYPFIPLFPNTIFVAGLTILEPVPEDLEVNKVSSLEDIPDDDQTGEKPKGRGKTYLFIFFHYVYETAGLELVLRHTEKSCIPSYYRQFSTNIF